MATTFGATPAQMEEGSTDEKKASATPAAVGAVPRRRWGNFRGASKHVQQWRSHRMATLRVFTFVEGTVLSHPILWIEQAITCSIFVTFLLGICYSKPSWYTDDWAATTGSNIQSFTSLLSALAGFLLSFYIALCINRWWDMRINGIQQIQNASSELTMFLSRCVTDDPMALDAVSRYTRASLLLLVMQHKPYDHCLRELKDAKILTEDELEKMCNMSNVAESIWTWITQIIVLLHKKGKIGPGPLYCFLLGLADQGRDGAARIGSVVTTPIPLIYVHLLCLMVKIHNFLVAILMAIVAAAFYMNGRYFLLVQAIGRTFLMPIIYNAILLICETLSDPFSGDLGDFPIKDYLDQMSENAKGYRTAGENIPDWIAERKQENAAKQEALKIAAK